jgi:hypothetical protein
MPSDMVGRLQPNIERGCYQPRSEGRTESELGYYRIEDDGPLILTVSGLLIADGRRLALEFYRPPGQ